MSRYNGEVVMTVGTAAKQLGIGRKTLLGAIIGKRIEGYKAVGKTGETVWLVPIRVVRELQQRVKEGNDGNQ